MSKKLDTGNLPSRRGNKRLKLDSSTPSTTPVLVLDHVTLAQPPVASKVDASLPHPVVYPSSFTL